MVCSFLDQLNSFIEELGADYKVIGEMYYFYNNAFVIIPIPAPHSNKLHKLDNVTELPHTLLKSDTLYLYEDRWQNNSKAIKERIKARLGVFTSLFARKCSVVNGDKIERTSTLVHPLKFADLHHNYGSAKAKYKYTLVYNERVVAAALFSPSRPMIRLLSCIYKNLLQQNRNKVFILNKIIGVYKTFSSKYNNSVKEGRVGERLYLDEHSWLAIEFESFEWIRYVSEPNIRVVGGMSRLLSAFINDVRSRGNNKYQKRYIEIMSYSDTEWSGGESYAKLNFIEVANRVPVEYYVCRESFKRYSARELLKIYNNTHAELVMARNITNIPLSFLSNFYKIKNRGSKKFLLHIN